MTKILQNTELYVRKKLEGEGSDHDWWHIHRVRNTALRLTKEEKANLFIVELAALLHDIADHKFNNGDINIGPEIAGEWLRSVKVEEDTIKHVKEIIADLPFKGANVPTPMKPSKGKLCKMPTDLMPLELLVLLVHSHMVVIDIERYINLKNPY